MSVRRAEGLREAAEDELDRILVEVDEDVAAEDHVGARRGSASPGLTRFRRSNRVSDRASAQTDQ